MTLDTKKVERIYTSRGKNISGKDRFDLRKGAILCLSEARNLVDRIPLPEGYITSQRNKFVPVWMSGNPLYLEWEVYSDRRIIGVRNYDEHARPNEIKEELKENFIERIFERKEVIGMLPMDDESKTRIAEYQKLTNRFNPEYLEKGIAIII